MPIVFYQISQLGFQFAMLINGTMFIVFVIAALISEKFYTEEELQQFENKAHDLS